MELLLLEEETQTLHAWRLGYLDARFQAGFLDDGWLVFWLLHVASWLAARLASRLPRSLEGGLSLLGTTLSGDLLLL